MKVFKFGGASVSTAERIRNVAAILKNDENGKRLLVISAMGKTTNALEKVAECFYAGEQKEALLLFEDIKQQHRSVAEELLSEPLLQLNDFFTEVEWLLHDKPARHFDYYYDQIVCVGELLATTIVSHYLNRAGVSNYWLDVRDILRTDDNFRDARIDWPYTKNKVENDIVPLFQQYDVLLTQGFVGATDENESTTLGREGSDYTAAVFAHLLNAESQVIWKDVPGVMNADPKRYPKAELIRELNYREVIEMAYYGAQVIHPKTIKPLQNKNIPLQVKSFLHPDADGTVIHNRSVNHLPPIIVHKEAQVLVQLTSKDFSFVGEGLTAELFTIFNHLKFRPNLTQNAAISILCVVDDLPEKVEHLAHAADAHFNVQVSKQLRLLTIRHYHQVIVNELLHHQKIILQQQTPETIQVLIQEE